MNGLQDAEQRSFITGCPKARAIGAPPFYAQLSREVRQNAQTAYDWGGKVVTRRAAQLSEEFFNAAF